MASYIKTARYIPMTSEIGQINVNPKTIGVALKEKGLWVPPNQRDYAWERDNVKDLYDDFSLAIIGGVTEYFLGSIVVISDQTSKYSMVVDGQQRLATTVILLAAIRDFYLEKKDEEGAKLIESDFIMSKHRKSRVINPHLKLNDTDHDYFERRVLCRADDERRKSLVKPTKPSHDLIDKAARMAASRVRDIVKGESRTNQFAALEQWTDFVEDAATVVWVEVPDESSAYKIFETMNDRGLALSANDLIKNYLLATVSKTRFEEIKANWISMHGTLETVVEKEMAKTYIRHFWISKHGRVRNNELFDGIKEKYKNEAKVIELSSDLLARSTEYVALSTPSHALWTRNEYRHVVPKSIETLQLLGVIQMRPLFLSVLQTFKPKEIAKLFKMSVSWAVRLIIAGRQGTGSLEGLYGDVSLNIAKGGLKTAADVARLMLKEVPHDTVFESAFAGASVTKSPIARYYLQCLERHVMNDPEALWTPNPDASEVTLEHIMPQNPEGKWQHIPATVFESHTRRIGNLALLKFSDNSTHAANDEFEVKKPILRDSSQYEITKWAGKATEWNAEAIETRQLRMAKLAVKTWKV
jgi:hypothetical protein